MDVVLLKQMRGKKIEPLSAASHLLGVDSYRCAGCEKKFYFRFEDRESPQYDFKSKKQYCHRCWHRFDFVSPVSRSGCRLCDITAASKKRKIGVVRHPKSIQETSEAEPENNLGIEPTTASWEQSRVRSSTVVPKGRHSGKNKKNRRTRT